MIRSISAAVIDKVHDVCMGWMERFGYLSKKDIFGYDSEQKCWFN